MPAGVPQIPKHSLFDLREHRKRQGICHETCGSTRKRQSICHETCGSTRKRQSICRETCGSTRKRQSVLFPRCGSPAGHFQRRFGHRAASVETLCGPYSYVELTLTKREASAEAGRLGQAPGSLPCFGRGLDCFCPPFPLSKQETKQHDRRHPPFHFSHSRLDPPNAPCPGVCRPRRVWPGTRQTWLASLTPRAHRLNRLGVCLGSLPVVGLLLGTNYSFYLFSF